MRAPAVTPESIELLGGGGHALVVAESALLLGLSVAGAWDDHPEPSVTRLGLARLGPLGAFAPRPGTRWILALGDLARRREILTRRGPDRAMSLAHPRAVVSPSAEVGAGTWVGPGAVIHTLARVGAHAIVNSGAIIEHECEIGENAHIAPGAALGGRVRVGADTLVGLGSRVLPGVSVGRGCVIGAGATVIRDVPDGACVVGVPAREPRR
ncbi:MAG: acetyltransferase [Phycisphaerales bacterium]|nr:acetyltransferase [Phycisphaerales bacterium]